MKNSAKLFLYASALILNLIGKYNKSGKKTVYFLPNVIYHRIFIIINKFLTLC